jgi:glycosyltransferase involved in cell wall biosynthesis
VDLFDRDEGIDVHERFGLPRNALTVLFANRLEPRKGIHLFGEVALHTMKRYPHVHFVVAGRDLFGHVANEILPKVQEAGCGPRFHVLGGRDLSEVRALLKRTDIFCLPSVWENCPYSCLEAMTASRAIVASDCGGMPELITDRVNGLLAHTGDAESFTTRLEELIERPDLRERLGRMARHTVETRLTNLETARRTVDIYRGVPAASEEFASPGV